jgi:hypothetical protein
MNMGRGYRRERVGLFRRWWRRARLLHAGCIIGAATHVASRQISENHVEICRGNHIVRLVVVEDKSSRGESCDK